MRVYAKERPGRWVVFDRDESGALSRLYSTNGVPTFPTGERMPRIKWPESYRGNGSIVDQIKIKEEV